MIAEKFIFLIRLIHVKKLLLFDYANKFKWAPTIFLLRGGIFCQFDYLGLCETLSEIEKPQLKPQLNFPTYP